MPKKILDGIVVSDKGEKSITVLVERKYQHPVLQKVVKTKKLETKTAMIVANTRRGDLLIFNIVFFKTYENLYIIYLTM